jgi:hypothetical protein
MPLQQSWGVRLLAGCKCWEGSSSLHSEGEAVGSTKRIEVELAFLGTHAVVERPKGTFRGGVPDPSLTPSFGFNLHATHEDEEGVLSPQPGAGSVAATFQLNMWGTSTDFRELGRYLLAIAELDTTADPGFHQHHDELISDDGNTRIDLIVRKVAS